MTDPATGGPFGAPYLAVDVQPDVLAGVFSLDVSELDGTDQLGLLAKDAGVWQNVVCDVRAVSSRRGATQLQGILTRADAGAVTVQLDDYAGQLDPLQNEDTVHRGTPFRLRAWGYAPGVEWDVDRTNLVTNPHVSPTVGFAGWTTNNGGTPAGATVQSFEPTGAPDGGSYARATFTAAPVLAFYGWRMDGRPSSARPLTVTAGTTYSASIAVRNSAQQSMLVRFYWYNAAGSELAQSSGSTVTVPANTWQRLSATGVAPTGATHVLVAAYVTAAPFLPINGTMDACMGVLETGSVAGPYFDGDTADTTDVQQQWTGTAHTSTSTQSVAVDTVLPWSATLFTGFVDELAAAYVPGGPTQVTVTATDLIAELAAWEAEGRSGDGIGAGDTLRGRVERVFTEVGFGTVAPDSDTTYAATLNPSTLDRAWDVIAAAADAELGRVWVDTSNRLVIRRRDSAITGPIRGTLSDLHGDAPVGLHMCMSAADVVLGPEQLSNRAVGSRRRLESETSGTNPPPEVVVRSEDTYSQARYGVVTVDRRGQLELETDGQVSPWVRAVTAAGGRSDVRVDSVTPSPTQDDLEESLLQWQAVMQTTIGDRWRFRFRPATGVLVDRTVRVLGVELQLTPDDWTVRWTTVPA